MVVHRAGSVQPELIHGGRRPGAPGQGHGGAQRQADGQLQAGALVSPHQLDVDPGLAALAGGQIAIEDVPGEREEVGVGRAGRSGNRLG